MSLTTRQLRILVVMDELGRATARDIAHHAGYALEDVYEVLVALEGAGMAQVNVAPNWADSREWSRPMGCDYMSTRKAA